jgi:predicted Zn-dependent protease
MRLVLFLVFAVSLAAQPADIEQRTRAARELVVAGKAEEAIPIYLDLARALPNDPGVLVNLSIAEFKSKRYRDAAAHAEAALKLQPDSPAANLFLGSSYAALGEHARSVGPLEQVLAAKPNDRNARVMLAEAMLALERYDDAAAQFRRASELAPESPGVWYGLGRSFEALSELAFNQLEQRAPESPYWLALSGDIYLKQRRYGSAFTEYTRALSRPNAPRGIHASLAAVYKQTGHRDWASIEQQREPNIAGDCRPQELECDFIAGRNREIVETTRNSGTPEALYWASKAYAELARQAYDRLAQLPASLETHLHAARALDADGLYQQAAGEWRQALKLSPENAEVQAGLVWALYRGGDHAAALPLLIEFIKARPDSRDLQFLCGASLLSLDQPEIAIPYLEIALRLDPLFLPVQAALGHALLLAGKGAQAIPHLQAALPSDEDAATHFQLLRAYQLTGQTDLARQALADYQKTRTSLAERRKIEEGAGITPP